ncbi:unnamed protein product [Rotaria socialis]|uniref:Transporter n=1 Tax=Rotaria socialis TaxID=392032 RepID=A0A817SBT9_9BILA|nr:unnamed protein product [Rotaria socialis]
MVSNPFTRCCKPKAPVSPTKDSNDKNADQDEPEDVHQWDRPIEFVLSLISNSVGLGNVWRFPYLAAKSGGGAFLIPYFTLYFLIGAPLYYMELALGQFSSRGPATGFELAKGWRGVGIAMIVNSVLGMLSYNVIISWAFFYFVLSFRKKLLWSQCGNWWNSDRCFVPGSRYEVYKINGTTWNCTEAQYNNFSSYGCSPFNTTGRVTATEEFYYRLLLKKSSSFDDFGTPGTYMAVCLLAAWVIVCLCIIRGVQSSGKACSISFYLFLNTYINVLEGAVDGIKYYVIPRWHLLKDFKIWQSAASQVFFSLSLSFGSLMAYASANKFNNNFFRQMCIVVSCDCFTGIFAGFAVFATAGFLAKSLGESIEKYAESSGPGLAFITYPEALSRMPGSPFFSVIFFLMLLALGLGSQFASTDVPVTAIMEYIPALQKRRSLVVVVTCALCYVISLPFTCPGGIYLFSLFQEYTANISLVVIGFFEVVTVAYVYGFNRFMNDVKMMLGYPAGKYYLFFTWLISAPILTLAITILNFMNTQSLKDGAGGGFDEYVYPKWSAILGWIIFAFCILPIPVCYILNYIQEYRKLSRRSLIESTPSNYGNFSSRYRFLRAFKANNSPSDDWGPKKKVNQYGDYAHLNPNSIANKNIANSHNLSTPQDINTIHDTTDVANPAMDPDFSTNDYTIRERF